jgi:hypothetical protein
MKRLVVLSVVALLVVSAGCGMTSQAANDARNEETTTLTTTTGSGSNPSDTAPVGAMLPEGYSQQGIDDPATAVEQHKAALNNASYRTQYQAKEQEGNASKLVRAVLTNVSVESDQYYQTVYGPGGEVTREVFQASNSRTTRTVGADGDAEISTEESPFAVTTGMPENRSLEDVLSKLEISGVEPRTMGGVTFIEFTVSGYEGKTVETSHFFIYPSGRIRVLMVQFEDGQFTYMSLQQGQVTVQQPEWAGSGSADS